jgi:hypothetical protein
MSNQFVFVREWCFSRSLITFMEKPMTNEIKKEDKKQARRRRTHEQSELLKEAIKVIYLHRKESTKLVDISLEELGNLFNVTKAHVSWVLSKAGIDVEYASNEVGVNDLLDQLRQLKRDLPREFKQQRKRLSVKAIADHIGLSEPRVNQLYKPRTKTTPEVRERLQSLLDEFTNKPKQ